jgi:WD40 repeat protein
MAVKTANSVSVLDVDYNPNKPNQFATCGGDCSVSIWDSRNTKESLMTISHHTHWVWDVSYNSSHDQLLLTSGSDCQVNLESIVSVSSDPFSESSGNDNEDDGEDGHE